MNKTPDQLSLNIQLDDTASLEKFIHCETNKSALELIKGTLSNQSVSDLYYIWGREGVGKSYIARALNRGFLNDNKQIFHISLKDERISSYEVFQNLGSLDIVIVEDIDLLPKEKEWELAIFSLINEALEGSFKIYLTSKVVSKELRIQLADLRSRLSYCTAIEIPEISEEEKIEALIQSSKRKGIFLDANTIQFIINNTSRSLTDLLGLIEEIDNFSLKKKKKVTPFLIRELLKTRSDSFHK